MVCGDSFLRICCAGRVADGTGGGVGSGGGRKVRWRSDLAGNGGAGTPPLSSLLSTCDTNISKCTKTKKCVCIHVRIHASLLYTKLYV